MDEEKFRDIVTSQSWWKNLPRSIFSELERFETNQSWFEVYRVEAEVYVFYEPGQFEEAISYLVLGSEKAILVDTGCGIGNIKALTEEFTDLPVMVVNTHHHYDHVAQNYLFDEIAIFDDPVARKTAMEGYNNDEMMRLLGEGLVWKPLPENFNPDVYHVPPFKVSRWLRDGDQIDLGGRVLEVIHTPGHSPDSICLLDRDSRLLWTGDIFYTGAIYVHLEGGDLNTFIESYKRMIGQFPLYDRLMSSHNEPWIPKKILRSVLKAAVEIRHGIGEHIEDGEGNRRFDYGGFSLIVGPSRNGIISRRT
jgi:glyoxylase-like metal-dependent hydrolase (beta-lactamase superfamily II)